MWSLVFSAHNTYLALYADRTSNHNSARPKFEYSSRFREKDHIGKHSMMAEPQLKGTNINQVKRQHYLGMDLISWMHVLGNT